MQIISRIVTGLFLFVLVLGCNEEDIKKQEEKTPASSEKSGQRKIQDTSIVHPIDTTGVKIDSTTQVSQIGGSHSPHYLKPEINTYGHYVYLPANYHTTEKFPLIIFLHGMGERGNSEKDTIVLSRVLRNGLPKMIEKKTWQNRHNAIVISPQCHDGSWNPQKLNMFIQYVLKEYSIDRSRIYLTGISMGAFGVFDYIGAFGDSSLIAAALPICGGGNVNKGSSFKNIPVWAFHGSDDKVVPAHKSKLMIESINKNNPINKAKLTIFPKVGHFSWNMAYDTSGMGKESQTYDPFNMDVFTWMFQFQRSL